MWSTIIYIVLLVLGTAGYAYYLYKVILNKRKQKEETKKGKTDFWLMAVFGALIVMSGELLMWKWLSPHITNEFALYFLFTLIEIFYIMVVSIIVKCIAKNKHSSDEKE